MTKTPGDLEACEFKVTADERYEKTTTTNLS